MYPKVGERIRVIGSWRGQEYDVQGVVLREGRMVRSGAVLGKILAEGGRVGRRQVPVGNVVWIPWSLQYVRFERVN
jgi:tRNA U34 5-carboxymethylaminomethyl modifying enzyme MnmG/GidA